ncbi:hypothetical protein U1P98_12620 [Lysinibacillus irui]|uniref:Uncharacterized protein n=1 Tax=Lysinibacillus irui TaxID=2998077 RepID=A0ABU5NM81_9BACI|nr:hypothetical protein [Lysinibacillus irui]MEA0555561.1 hypothetical protein [Lysinibacillus irui]MEA0977146.1 hypothetical protein [Lysinibacillus irui]MEA1043300.1 hypothetical protein [Lysinibacillus irui]
MFEEWFKHVIVKVSIYINTVEGNDSLKGWKVIQKEKQPLHIVVKVIQKVMKPLQFEEKVIQKEKQPLQIEVKVIQKRMKPLQGK